MRLESDSIGTLEVPIKAYYGVQTLRAKHNFNITKRPLHPVFINNLARIKKAAAMTNMAANVLDERIGKAILQACDEIIAGKLHNQFIVDAIQGGAGTSANMNANEVIANRAIEILGGEKGDYSIVHPNDHVNMAQSTNDVIPSAGKLTILELLPGLVKELKRLHKALQQKSVEFDDVVKIGRTQLQDAVPIRLGQSFEAYSAVVRRDIERLEGLDEDLKMLNIGATAVGTAINVNPVYLFHIIKNVNLVCQTSCYQAENLFDATQNLDGFVNISSALKTCAVSLSKICNDLRLLSSGPKTGLGEINLPPKQNGSSIMPGKINPVIPEVVSQVAFNVIGNDVTVTLAAEAGQLELNAFEPVIFYNIFESIDTLTGAVQTLIDNCILGITANRDRCEHLVESSAAIATALCPSIGYKKAADIAKQSLESGVSVRDLVLQQNLMTPQQLEQCMNLKALTLPGHMAEYRKM
ncbi:MAG: aspartate ammonia-lyase [Hungatella sp.]|jgi:aspartate ammonia-lyase|nr:aspartate ammonia-lyase [Hungatella sp.]